MDTSEIYEKIMMEECFNKLKAVRNRWKEEEEKTYGLAPIIDIGGADYRLYNFIMNQCNSIIMEMIPYLVIELMKAYKIDAKVYKINQNDAHVYSVKNKNWPDYVEQANPKKVFAFICKGNHKEVLYIFKEIGIGNCIPDTLLKKIKSQNGLKRHCYISLVEKDTYSEVINHNNGNGATRGLEICSLKQFFDFIFGVEEYTRFKKYKDEFTQKVKDYFGLEIVRVLKLNTLHNFREKVKRSLENFEVKELDAESRLSEEQKKILDKNFRECNGNNILTGSSDFAQSYMTAEWFYESLPEAENIDLTAIAMGYFKAIEQLLFCFISLHTMEKDGISRNIYSGKRGEIELTDSVIRDENITKDINLGSLTGFFGFFNNKKNQYLPKNKDLLVDSINDITYEYIVDVFSKIVGLRNGFFHKHNLKEWNKVVEARNNARLVFYLLLGAYKIRNDDKGVLGVIKTDVHDGYYKLCEYINNATSSDDGFSLPIFYMNGQTELYAFWFPYRDDFVEYDIYGEPIYSGAYFRSLDKKQPIRKATRENVPNEIWEGVLNISRSAPIEFKPSGPQRMIYKNGEFFEK